MESRMNIAKGKTKDRLDEDFCAAKALGTISIPKPLRITGKFAFPYAIFKLIFL